MIPLVKKLKLLHCEDDRGAKSELGGKMHKF